MSGDTHAAPEAHGHRAAPLGTIIQVLVAISVVAFLIVLIGSIADWKGFSEDKNDNSAFADISWVTFTLSALLAFLLGVVTLIRARRHADPVGQRAAMPGVVWLPLALVLSIIGNALT